MTSYGWDLLDALPTRRLHSDSSRIMHRDVGFRTQTWSRGTASSLKHSPLSATLLQRPSDSMQLYQSGAFSEDHIAVSLNEKLLLQGLNDRFAGFIDKVRQLEQQNQGLESEIAALRESQSNRSGLASIYEPEMLELRSLLLETENQKTQFLLESDHLKEKVQRLKEKFEAEVQARLDTEASLQACKKDQGNSNLVRLELERKVQSLTDEILFLKQNHEEEVSDLFSQVQASQVSVEMKDFTKPDLAGALKAIRSQMEGCTSVNMQQAEEWFASRVAKLNDAAALNKEALQRNRQEISEYNRQLQCKNIELETLRGRKECLEKQLNDAEARHDGELIQYQDAIQQLENELKSTKQEMSRHLREYQDLLNVKMALDVEIASYRKLLEGEETRFGDFTPSTYTYKLQPIAHTAYVTTKTKATSTKVMPQYRFVEEIISATTKEINMAELEAVDYKPVDDQEVKPEGEAAEKEEDGKPIASTEEKEEEEEKEADEAEDKGEGEQEPAKEATDEEKADKDKGEEKVEKAEEDKDEEKVEKAEEDKDEEKVEKAEEDKDEEKVEKAEEDKDEEKVEKAAEDKDEEKVEKTEEDKAEEKVEKTEEDKAEELVEKTEEDKGEEKIEKAEEKVEKEEEEKVERKAEEKAEEKAVEEKAKVKNGEKVEKTEEKAKEEKAEDRKAAEVAKVEEAVEQAEEKVKEKDREKAEEKEDGEKAEKAKDEEKISKEKSEEKEVSKMKAAEGVSEDSQTGVEHVEGKPKEKAEETKDSETKAVTEQGASETTEITAEGDKTQVAEDTETGPMEHAETKLTESGAKDGAATTGKGQ